MNSNLLAIAISWASMLSGYDKFPADEITVVPIPRAEMAELVCGPEVKRCPAFAWYNYEEHPNKIFIADGIQNHPRFLGLPVHEVVHVMQFRKFGFPNCEESLKWEFEAYRVQDEYLIQNGTRAPFCPLFGLSCKYTGE